jgi:hypothetical protein
MTSITKLNEALTALDNAAAALRDREIAVNNRQRVYELEIENARMGILQARNEQAAKARRVALELAKVFTHALRKKKLTGITKQQLATLEAVSNHAVACVATVHNCYSPALELSVNEIELSVRAANALNNANISTVGELLAFGEKRLRACRNVGNITIAELKDAMSQRGLSLLP